MISNYMIPSIVFFVLVYAIHKKVDVYDTFLEGSKESFKMILNLFPCLFAMILAVNIFIKSGVMDIFRFISIFPHQIIPMIITRPISGTSSLAILTNIFREYGPDSILGYMASFIQGGTDTTFYIITLYFGSIGIKKIKYALWAGLLADLISIAISIIYVKVAFM